MNDSSNTAAGLDQAEEELLARAVSDEALEAAARTEGAALTPSWSCKFDPLCP
jgi:hypothetical protein